MYSNSPFRDLTSFDVLVQSAKQDTQSLGLLKGQYTSSLADLIV